MLREARRLGQIGADDYDRATDLGTIKAERLPRGRLVAEAEVAARLRTCAGDPTPAGARDAAIIALLRGTGLRRAAAAALNLADYDPESGGITVQRGKGNKDRILYAPAGARAALADWLAVRGAEAGPLDAGADIAVVQRLAGHEDPATTSRYDRRGEAAK